MALLALFPLQFNFGETPCNKFRSRQASSAYLEQMGSFVAWLILDVSPGTIDRRKTSCPPMPSPRSMARSKRAMRWKPSA
jgi:hypothetical protein